MPKKPVTRRKFLGDALLAGAAFTIVPRHVLGGVGYTPPSEVITRGVIGTGGMGMAAHVKPNLEGQPPVTLAVCDVDQKHLARALKKAGDGCDGYSDWRRVLATGRRSSPTTPVSTRCLRCSRSTACTWSRSKRSGERPS